MSHNSINLTATEALVLQQINEDGEDDIRSLAFALGMPRNLVTAIAVRLEEKGLVAFHHSFSGLWMDVSQRGKRLIRAMWPEANATYA